MTASDALKCILGSLGAAIYDCPANEEVVAKKDSKAGGASDKKKKNRCLTLDLTIPSIDFLECFRDETGSYREHVGLVLVLFLVIVAYILYFVLCILAYYCHFGVHRPIWSRAYQ